MLKRMRARIVVVRRSRGSLPGFVPGRELTADVAVALAELSESHSVRVHGMKIGQDIDKGMRKPDAKLRRYQSFGVRRAVKRSAIHMSHDIESRAGNR